MNNEQKNGKNKLRNIRKPNVNKNKSIPVKKIFAMAIMCHDSNMNLKSKRFVDVFFFL